MIAAARGYWRGRILRLQRDAPLSADEPKVDEALAIAHGLKPDEYARFVKLIGRTPTFTELGVFSDVERALLVQVLAACTCKRLPTKGPRVIQGPGENAGVVDIGDGFAAVFKMESHNHP